MLSLAVLVKPKLTYGLAKLSEFLYRNRSILIGLVTVGFGSFLGYQLSSPGLALPTISVLVIFVDLLLIIYRPLYGLLAWLMLDSFIETWIKIPMGAGLPDLSFARFTIAFLGIFMLAQGAIGKFRFARIGITDICIVATTIGILISSPLAVNPRGAVLYAISKHATPLVIFFFAKNLVQDRPKLHKMFWVLLPRPTPFLK